MKSKYAYLGDSHRCIGCSFPECAHTTDETHRLHKEGNQETEMRLVGSSDGIDYYMEFATHPFLKNKFIFNIPDKVNYK